MTKVKGTNVHSHLHTGEAIKRLTAERDALRAENEALASNLRGKHALAGATYKHLTAERDARFYEPPCMECGAKTPDEAEKLCRGGGDKDDCHGCQLWPDR